MNMREDFENAMRAKGYSQFEMVGDHYRCDDIEQLWQGFKLGREYFNNEDSRLLDELEKVIRIATRYSPPDHKKETAIYAFRLSIEGENLRDALSKAIVNEPAYLEYINRLYEAR